MSDCIKCIFKEIHSALYTKELLKLGFSATLMFDAVSYNVMKIKNHHNKNPNIFALYIYLV